MAILKPFRALRPVPEMAKQVSCVPYDVVGEDEVREFLAEHPLSFLKVTRAEGDLAEGQTGSEDEVFDRARRNLEEFIANGVYAVDQAEALCVYQLSSDEHTQTGVVGCCSLDEYANGAIKKHEKVRPDKVEDRTAHLLAVGAQTGLILLTFRGTRGTRRLIEEAVRTEPIYNFECIDGIGQKVWRVPETQDWVRAFAEVDSLYIADGHHRIESALLARERRAADNPSHAGDEEYNFVVAGIFPAEELRILPYNRVVADINGLGMDEFYERLSKDFEVTETAERVPSRHGEICVYASGEWRKLIFKRLSNEETDPIERLDVSILQHYILEPLLGVKDARTDERIGFVGGRRGVAEIEKMVDSGEAAVGFSMFATTMDDMLTISDMGEMMPPKSTWFEPKLKDGLLVHLI